MIEQNKALVTKFFDTLSSGDVDAAFDMVDEKTEWTVPLSLSQTPLKRDVVKARAKLMHKSSGGTYRQWVVAMTAEGDKVAAQVQSRASLGEGREYANKYHYLFLIKDQKIVQVTAYHDSAHAKEVLMGAIASGKLVGSQVDSTNMSA